MPALLAIDQGTTSSRAILFAQGGTRLAVAQRELPQSFPQPGWVEHDPQRIWEDSLLCAREVLATAAVPVAEVAALGITNQRETAILWDRKTGRPIHSAIVWQDRRTSDFCLRHAALSEWIGDKTGLLLDPYFSATKIAWLLDHVPHARVAAEAGRLAFGTVDTWLLWKLTGGHSGRRQPMHATDATNASRTALFDIHHQRWDPELLDFFRIPASLLPEVKDSADDYGSSDPELFGGSIAIRGIAGDQQAATVGQSCIAPGMIKATYGTGCFVVLNTGDEVRRSRHRLLSTVAYRLQGKPTFALEGSIFLAGAAVQWLRDAVHLIKAAGETAGLAASVPDTGGVYLVPAFTGLGAPYWDPEARGAIVGLTRDSGIAQIVRAALEAVCYQTRDLLDALADDGPAPTELRVDGGMIANDWLAQCLADLVGLPVVRPASVETTALGAALLAGIGAGIFGSLEELAARWQAEAHFEPAMEAERADRLRAGWHQAVERVRTR